MATERNCEMCEERPGKFYCQDCESYVCMKDIEEHKKRLPDLPHKVIKAKEAPQLAKQETGSLLNTERLDGHFTSSFDSSAEPVRSITDDFSLFESSIKSSESQIGEIQQVPASSFLVESVNPDKWFSGQIFASHIDNAANYTLQKWVLRAENADALIQAVSKLPTVQVIGVYGCLNESLFFASQLLRLTTPPTLPLDCTEEGLIAFYRSDISLLCLVFKIQDEATYLEKPYPESSKESIYVRLLMDLCPVIVCCPSDLVLQNWYWSDDPILQNPYLPRIHPELQLIVKPNIPDNEPDEIEKIIVKSNFPVGDLCLTTDHLLNIFISNVVKFDGEDQYNIAVKRLKDWISKMKEQLQKGDYTDSEALSSFHEFDDASFQVFTQYLRSTFEVNSDLAINSIKNAYKEAMFHWKKSNADLLDNLYRKFTDRYKLVRQDSLSSNKVLFSPADHISLNFLQNVDQICTRLRPLILGFNVEEYQTTQLAAKESIDLFLKNELLELEEVRKGSLEGIFTDMYMQMERIIEAAASSLKTEQYLFKTFKIVIKDSTLRIEDKKVDHKIRLERQPTSSQFYVLGEKTAFVLLETVDSLQTYTFNPASNLTYDMRKQEQITSNILIASGSSADLFVAFSNSNRKVYYGSGEGSNLIDKSKTFDVYSESVRQVRSACLFQKERQIVLINEQGQVFTYKISNNTLALLTIEQQQVEHPDGERIRVPLRPASGDQFYDVKSSSDEKLYFLLSEKAIEIYDGNFTLTKQISVSSPNIAFKVLNSGQFAYVLIKTVEGGLDAYRFRNGNAEELKMEETDVKAEILGNPIIDILYSAIRKFGISGQFISTEPELYVSLNSKNLMVVKYIKSFQDRLMPLLYKEILLPRDISRFIENLVEYSYQSEEFKWRLLTRPPLHVTCIQEGNIIPLQDGFNHFEALINEMTETKVPLVEAFVKYTTLGCLERLISESKNIKVISIMGRQSSGKSYLLNCLFGTRFDVSPTRCTDGIWISVARSKEGQVILVMDCEGLFSTERTVQEEIKLCLLLAAISDITILNQDLTFDRHLADLFQKFTFGIDRLKCKDWFQGCLEVAIRDVPENQGSQANAQLFDFLVKMQSTGKADFLRRLFNGQFNCVSYHNFENKSLFNSKVSEKSAFYLTKTIFRWESGENLLLNLKTAIAKIYADDGTITDLTLYSLRVNRVLEEVKKAINNLDTLSKLLSPDNPPISVRLTAGRLKCDFQMLLFDLSLNLVDPTLNLKSRYIAFEQHLGNYIDQSIKLDNWKDWYDLVDSFIKIYFRQLKASVFHYFDTCAPVADEFQPVLEGAKTILEKHFDSSLMLPYYICRCQCSKCELTCLKPQNHVESCDCSTDHGCHTECSVCKLPETCAQKAGHKGGHFCISKPHLCGQSCSVSDCEDHCVGALYHVGPHKCNSVSHKCKSQCAMFTLCKRMCSIDQAVLHVIHDCGQQNCPYKCGMEPCEEKCANANHIHGEEYYRSRTVSRSSKPIHFCNKPHRCPKFCKLKGVCEIVPTPEKRIWKSESDEFPYYYVNLSNVTRACVIQIPVGYEFHDGDHRCARRLHTCVETCPDCGAFCELPFSHDGLHSSAAHRNKEKCIYLSKRRDFEYENEETHTTRKFKAGEPAKPEICDQSCKRKGRGHTHPKQCPGGIACLQVTMPGKAIHSMDTYYPELNKIYDLVECSTYWHLHGWEAPLQQKMASEQREFGKCPCYCASPEHKIKVYCEGLLFHTSSVMHRDHIFLNCPHKAPFEYNISFILDCTGSMQPCFDQVKKVITAIITRYKFPTKFAIVGYTDHSPDNGEFPAAIPVKIYPESGNLAEFQREAALSFLASLRATGGGGQLGEAMLDGMNRSNMLIYTPGASRLNFIIGDDSPHGKEFLHNTTYPEGCPCGLKWREILGTMKAARTELRLVKIGNLLNVTADLFRQAYGEGFDAISLDGMANLSLEVEKSIVAIIEHNMEFAQEIP